MKTFIDLFANAMVVLVLVLVLVWATGCASKSYLVDRSECEQGLSKYLYCKKVHEVH